MPPHGYDTLRGREALRRTRSATLDTRSIGKGAFELTVLGRVAGLWRYPVKSMAAEELDAVEVSWDGLAGDRLRAFIRAGQVRSGFPWLTIRERPQLAHYQPRFAEPDRPNASATLVRTPSGGELEVADAALAADLGPGVRVIKQDRGVFDTMPLSLLSTQTLAGLGRYHGPFGINKGFGLGRLNVRAGQPGPVAWLLTAPGHGSARGAG